MPSIHLLTALAALATSNVAAPASPASVQAIAARSEPTAWTPLLLGFGALGAVLRRRPVRPGATLI